MANIEFQNTPQGELLIVTDGGVELLSEDSCDLVNNLYGLIAERYPDAMAALSNIYKQSHANKKFYRWRIVRRFIKCNFCGTDNKIDWEASGRINFEYVSCPLKGVMPKDCEYENVICNPKFNSGLSPREEEIMRLYAEGLSSEDIGVRLFLSVETVRTHKRNVLAKTKCHTLTEFLAFASLYNLWN